MPIVFCASLPPWPRRIQPLTPVAGAETSVTPRGELRRRSTRPQHHQQAAQKKTDQRRDEDKQQYLAETEPDDWRNAAGICHCRPDQAADQGVRGRGGDAVIPGDDVPGQRPAQRPEYHVVVDELRIDRSLADGSGHLEMKHPERDEVEEGGEGDCLPRCQCAGGDDRRNRIGAVVKAVHEIEGERQRHQQRDHPETDLDGLHRRAVSRRRAAPSRDCAPSGAASEASVGARMRLTSSRGPRPRSGWPRPRSGR